MSITAERKAEVITDPCPHRRATPGRAEVQVAILSERIANLTEHFKTHKKDNHSRRGLLKMVSQRRRLLDHLKKSDDGPLQALIEHAGPAPLGCEVRTGNRLSRRGRHVRASSVSTGRRDRGCGAARTRGLETGPHTRRGLDEVLRRLFNWRGSERPNARPLSAPAGNTPAGYERSENVRYQTQDHRVGRPHADPRNRPHRPSGRRRRPGHLRRDHRPGHRRLRQERRSRARTSSR